MSPAFVPLSGPLEQDPTTAVRELAVARGAADAEVVARAKPGAAVVGLPRGAWDEQILSWLSVKDSSVVATVASLLRRSFEAGVAAGRGEVIEETPWLTDLTGERDRYRAALTQIASVTAVFEAQMGGLTPSGVTGALVAAIKAELARSAR